MGFLFISVLVWSFQLNSLVQQYGMICGVISFDFKSMRLAIVFWTGFVFAAGYAQAGTPETGWGDVYGRGGYYTGVGLTFSSSNPNGDPVGGGVSGYIRNWLSVFGEGSYAAIGVSPFTSGIASLSTSGLMKQLVGGARLYPVLRAARVRPYFSLAAGMWHGQVTESGTVASCPAGYSCSVSSPLSDSRNGALLDVGVGVEVGVTKRLGFRPEFRYLRQYGTATTNPSNILVGPDALSLGAGIYYRIGK